MKTEAVAEDITDNILCDTDNNFVVHLRVHQDAECNDDYMFTQRPPTLKFIVKIGFVFHKPHKCALLHISLNTLYYKQLNSTELH